MGIDLRQIKCACNLPQCKTGISFDSNPDVLRFHDKHGEEHVMPLNKHTADQLIQYLKQVKTI